MKMRREKRRKGESFGKRFEGVHWENRKGVRSNEIEGWTMGRKSFFCMRFLCIYRTLLAAQKRIRTSILSTEHSLLFYSLQLGTVSENS